MGDPQRRMILLGPQQGYQSLRRAFSRLENDAPVALVTAGWEVDEEEDMAVKNAIPHPVYNLHLFKRSEQLFVDDPELIRRLRDRQDELRILRDVYRARLEFALGAARYLIGVHSEFEYDLDPELESSIDQVRQLDQQYLVRTSQICDAYDEELDTANRQQVVAQRNELRAILDNCGALVISGGHAAIILNRLRIFGILELASTQPVIAWSGGAMALADQVVFFHDSPPQGAGDPEVLRSGMGLIPELLPLPDAQNRLNLADNNRVQLFARRFSRYRCVELNERSLLDRREGQWQEFENAGELMKSGEVAELTR